LKVTASNIREMDIVPVKGCDTREAKENSVIKEIALGSVVKRYFNMK